MSRSILRAVLERPAQNQAALDGLRAFAILAVIAFHSVGMSTWATVAAQSRGELDLLRRLLFNLWSGVDVFFVLSGYLIGRMLIGDLRRHGRLFYSSFLVRRTSRIFPAYYVVLTVALLAAGPWLPPIFAALFGSLDPAALREGAWTQYLYVSNYLLGPQDPSVIRVNWSLCIEEQFYLVLPPLLWLVTRTRDRRWHLAGIGAGVLVPLGLRAAHYVTHPEAGVDTVWVQSHFRFDELFVGVLLAYVHVHWPERMTAWCRRLGPVLPVTGGLAFLSVLLYGSAFMGGAFRVVFQFALLAWGTAAIMAHVLTSESVLTRVLSARGWYPIARVSYGMYLVHPYMLFAWLSGPWTTLLVDAPLGWRVLVLFVATVAMSWSLSVLLFVAVERPLMQLGHRATRSLRTRSA